MESIKHLAIIMDGNGRWAWARGLSRPQGHIAGARNAFEIVAEVRRLGIPVMSLFAFSTENWKRPALEISLLMRLLAQSLEEKRSFFRLNGIKISVLGARDKLPAPVRAAIARAEDETCGNTGLHLAIAVNYSGREDICQAVRRLRAANKDLANLKADQLESAMWTCALPNPDLIIRTGGEFRISNFYLWQAAYSEIHFEEKFWPDFTPEDLKRHLRKFASCDRRYGAISV